MHRVGWKWVSSPHNGEEPFTLSSVIVVNGPELDNSMPAKPNTSRVSREPDQVALVVHRNLIPKNVHWDIPSFLWQSRG